MASKMAGSPISPASLSGVALTMTMNFILVSPLRSRAAGPPHCHDERRAGRLTEIDEKLRTPG
jgi:hypothetical protein